MSSNADERPRAAGNWLRWVGSVLSILLLIWLISQQAWEDIWQSVVGLSITQILLSYTVLFTGQIFNAFRWKALLRSQTTNVGTVRIIQLAFSGLFSSNFLPTTVGGDLVRIIGISPYTAGRLVATATVVADRLVSIIGMTTLVPFSLLTFGGKGITLSLGIIGSGSSSGLIGWIRNSIKRIGEALSYWREDRLALINAFFLSLLGVFCYLIGIWIMAKELNIQVSILDVAAVTGITYFLTLIPISINGYGVREVGMLSLYVSLGATAAAAGTLAVLTRLLLMLVSLPGALWLSRALNTDTRRLSRSHPSEK
jgi:uncharacterized membrane protein YbhN (UPF0104 family)